MIMMQKLKDFVSWSLNSWVGSLVMAACLTSLFFGGNYFLKARNSSESKPDPALSARIVNGFGLSEQWKQLVPEWFGIDEWARGQYAQYTMTGADGVTYAPEFQVVGKLEQDHKVARVNNMNAEGYFWMRSSGFKTFRNLPGSDFHVMSAADMRFIKKTLSFEFFDDYIPIENSVLTGYARAPQASLTRVGREKVTTPAGAFACDIYEADLGGMILKIWANPLVPPLGIVRLTSETETLELKAYGVETEDMKVPPIFQYVIDGVSTVAVGCSSCHASHHDLHTPVFPPK